MATAFGLLLLACLVSVSIAAPAVDIKKACEATTLPDFCVESLSADPTSKGANATGLVAIAIRNLVAIAIRNAIEGARNASDYITSNVKGSGENTPLGQCLATCAYNYGGVLVNLDWSAAAIRKNNYAGVSDMLTTAKNKASTCLLVCDGMVDPVADEALIRNDEFLKLADVATGVLLQTNT